MAPVTGGNAMSEHKVKKGETLSEIAKKHKIKDWKKLWEAKENKALVKKRKEPQLIQPGDVVIIPGEGDEKGKGSGAGKKESDKKEEASKSGSKSGKQSEADAVKKVDKHVEPKECFIWFMNSKEGYRALTEVSKNNTGCAHWISHQKGWNSGKAGSNGCNKGYLFRVKDIAAKSGSEVKTTDVKVGNVWVNDKLTHCGIVSKVTKAKDGAEPTIEIQHCSSGQGKVAKNDWKKHFKGGGKFLKG